MRGEERLGHYQSVTTNNCHDFTFIPYATIVPGYNLDVTWGEDACSKPGSDIIQ